MNEQYKTGAANQFRARFDTLESDGCEQKFSDEKKQIFADLWDSFGQEWDDTCQMKRPSKEILRFMQKQEFIPHKVVELVVCLKYFSVVFEMLCRGNQSTEWSTYGSYILQELLRVDPDFIYTIKGCPWWEFAEAFMRDVRSRPDRAISYRIMWTIFASLMEIDRDQMLANDPQGQHWFVQCLIAALSCLNIVECHTIMPEILRILKSLFRCRMDDMNECHIVFEMVVRVFRYKSEKKLLFLEETTSFLLIFNLCLKNQPEFIWKPYVNTDFVPAASRSLRLCEMTFYESARLLCRLGALPIDDHNYPETTFEEAIMAWILEYGREDERSVRIGFRLLRLMFLRSESSVVTDKLKQSIFRDWLDRLYLCDCKTRAAILSCASVCALRNVEVLTLVLNGTLPLLNLLTEWIDDTDADIESLYTVLLFFNNVHRNHTMIGFSDELLGSVLQRQLVEYITTHSCPAKKLEEEWNQFTTTYCL